MYISLANSREDGFKKWWDVHQPGNNDDTPGGATPIAITEPPCDDCDVIQEQPHIRGSCPEPADRSDLVITTAIIGTIGVDVRKIGFS